MKPITSCVPTSKGARVVRHSPSYDRVYSPLLYWLGTSVYGRVRGLGVMA
jgi:hypothetical protein